jgi:hypothetical protein
MSRVAIQLSLVAWIAMCGVVAGAISRRKGTGFGKGVLSGALMGALIAIVGLAIVGFATADFG